MALDLEGKIVVLTGGGDGIGRECALAYARAGASVAILELNIVAAKRTASELGVESMALHGDVSDGSAVQSAMAAGFYSKLFYKTAQHFVQPDCTRLAYLGSFGTSIGWGSAKVLLGLGLSCLINATVLLALGNR
jgi:NAD(P)-dependent dehydrogenase (short-subunit alcohol dehydrogenase family)